MKCKYSEIFFFCKLLHALGLAMQYDTRDQSVSLWSNNLVYFNDVNELIA